MYLSSNCCVLIIFLIIDCPVIVPAVFRAVTESINQLITVCAVSAAPGLKECDGAVRQIQVATTWQPCIVACWEKCLIIIIISTTMFMVLSSWQSHCESSAGSFDECRMAPSGCRPKTKPYDLGCESACTGCQKLHPPSPFIITQPES